jgi:hypothetical protein
MNATQIELIPDGIPEELKQLPHWVLWRWEQRNGRPTKPLYSAKSNDTPQYAKSNDPETWVDFTTALDKYNSDAKCFFQGIGFVLTNTPFVGIDFDGVVQNGQIEPYISEILRILGDPYVEFSPSGKGLHCFVRAPLPEGSKNRFGTKAYGAEVYGTLRYFCTTGSRFSGAGIPTHENINLAHFLISQITNAKLKSLWMGDMTEYANDQSRADLALLGILSRLLNGNGKLMEEYFGFSKLGQRGKWRDRPDYRKRSIEAALKPQTSIPENGQPAVTTVVHEPLHVDDATDFVNEQLAPRPMLLTPFLAERTLGMIHAWRGVGKTHVLLGMAVATASGGSFLKWKAPQPSPVVYVDGEMADEDIQLWLRETMSLDGMPQIQPGYLKLIAADRQDRNIPSLSTSIGQDMVREQIGDAKSLYLDNISCLFRGGDEKEGTDWEAAQEWLISLRREGISVILGHHDGKQGFQRGTSKREDPLNWVIQLKHPKNYQPEEGLRCEVHFEKARRLFGVDARPFECSLMTDAHGKATWVVKEMAEAMADAIRQLKNEQGMSFRDIAKELDISKSKVERLYNHPTNDLQAGF